MRDKIEIRIDVENPILLQRLLESIVSNLNDIEIPKLPEPIKPPEPLKLNTQDANLIAIQDKINEIITALQPSQ